MTQPNAPSPHIVDVTEATFERDVVEASMAVPVIVDFWAEWCGPCKTLGPILEGLADEYGGAVRLAKIDVDANPQLAAYFRAQSIPMVLVLYQGQLADQFTGAKPKAQVREFIDGILTRLGLPIPSGAEPIPTEPVAAEAYWRAASAKEPTSGLPLLNLGRALMAQGKVDDAAVEFNRIAPTMDGYSDAQAALALSGLLEPVVEAGGEATVRARLAANIEDAEAQYLVACADAAGGSLVPALEVFVALAGSAPAEIRANAKKSAAAVFQASDRNEAVDALRRKMARFLF